MKKIVRLSLILMAVIFATENAFTKDHPNGDGNKSGSLIFYSIYSVNPDKVSIWGLPLSLSSYCNNLRVDITGGFYMDNDIGATESISSWINSNPPGANTVAFYCNQSDADDVCLVKIAHIDILNIGVCEYVPGDVDMSVF